jgi:tetratricopeptide (TPR) repeat protein/TolB-like protein/DNA-binding winged helix-turn-helix (wHTH) protein
LNADLLQGFYLGDFFVEPLKGGVTGRSRSRHLPPKAVEVLLCLATTPGQLVTRETLIESVWGRGHGSHEALSHAVTEIRHALEDDTADPRFIQTLPTRGYRLVVDPVASSQFTGSVVIGADNAASIADLGIFESLQRRGVIETGVAYLVFGWLLIQIADIVFAQLHLPTWAGTFVTALVIAGFPIAIVLSWFLEFRDGKAVFDAPSPDAIQRRRFGRTYLSVIGGLAAAGVLVFAYDQYIGLPEAKPTVATMATAEITVADNSIAVLPFLNNDGSEETRIFANGLMDDVITRLSRVPGLLVSSRGDAATLQPNTSSEIVRNRLRVAMYLEGSVEIQGDQIRVIVQLINSANGFHILSRTFDRPKADFFAIRDEVTQLTVSSLRVTLPDTSKGLLGSADEEPGLDAYLLFRRGADLLNQPRTADTLDKALDWFDAALEVDPEYAAALAGKCRTFAWQLRKSHDSEYSPQAENACSMALELNPNLDVVHEALGRLYVETGRYGESAASFDRALRINSQNVDAMLGLSEVYRLQNQPEEAEKMLHEAIGLQPGDWNTYHTLGLFYFRQGRFAEATEQFGEVISINPSYARAHSNLGSSYMMMGDYDAALTTFKNSLEFRKDRLTYQNLGMVYYYLGRYDEAEAAMGAAIALAPERHLCWSNLGDILYVAGREHQAREAYLQARDLLDQRMMALPNDPQMQMDHAWVHAMLGDEDQALFEISKALKTAPDDPYASYIEGLIYNHFGEVEKAVASLEAAIVKGHSPIMLKTEPLLKDLRGNPRFVQISAADNKGRKQ